MAIIKLKFYCSVCGKLLQFCGGEDLYVVKDALQVSLKPCPRCLKAEYKTGHVEGQLDRDKALAKARKARARVAGRGGTKYGS